MKKSKTKRKFKKCTQCNGKGFNTVTAKGCGIKLTVDLMCMMCGGDGKEIVDEKD